VSDGRLFLVFPVLQDDRVEDQLAVLSLEGKEERVIDLGAYYPLHSPYLNSLVPDRKGGVYLLLPPAGVVHFDAELRSEFKYIGAEDLLLYEGLVVGWDGNIYTYSADRDALSKWGTDEERFMHNVVPLSWMGGTIAATPIISPTYSRLLGADVQGRLYFRTYEPGNSVWLIRVSTSWDEMAVARVPEGAQSLHSLAPDGSLYSIEYDPTDSSIKPRIVKCVLAQE
jgi:hypothetical protein